MLTAMRKIFIASIFVFTFCAFGFGQNSNCPTISITGPSAVPQEGEPVTFTVNIDENASDLKLNYVWSVSDGKILEGQGTAVITVEQGQNGSPTVTVEIKGLPEGCENVFSESVPCGLKTPPAKLLDESMFSDSKIDSTKFDEIVAALNEDSSAQIYIIIYYDKKTSTAKIAQKEEEIRQIVKSKNIPPKSIIIVQSGGKEGSIKFWLVPAGATPPTP